MNMDINLPYMKFEQQIMINKSNEDLTFISWGGDIITHFVIIGLTVPLAMVCKPFTSSWKFMEEIGDELKAYEMMFSNIINERMRTRENLVPQPVGDGRLR
jgi:hypothetical protein